MKPFQRQTNYQRAFTLIELVISMSIAGVLMGGLASALVLASRALPSQDSVLQQSQRGYQAGERLMSEIWEATSLVEHTTTKVTFMVADRDRDTAEEIISYTWSGVKGDPLMRTYNNGVGRVVVGQVYEFALNYTVESKGETTLQEGTVWSAETLLATFDGWDGMNGDLFDLSIAMSNWSSQFFSIEPPAEVTQIEITRANVVLYHMGAPPESVTVGIHRSSNDGNFFPVAVPIGTPASVLGTSLPMFGTWSEFVFSDVFVQDLTRSDYCLVVKGLGSGGAFAQYLYSRSAPDNGKYLRWSLDSGASWNPRNSQLDEQDLRFLVYGKYATISSQEITTYRDFVTAIDLKLRVGSLSSTLVETSVPMLNHPEIVTP